MKYHKIPDETIRRMPKYLRAFSMLKTANQDTISSSQLAERLHLNPPQIRKDLSYFGAFGTRGIGYPVASTAEKIRGILKLDVTQKAVLIGAGRLGAAIAEYPGFSMFGFDIAVIFDNDQSKIGTKVGKNTVEDIAKISKIRGLDIHLAILAIPCEVFAETGLAIKRSSPSKSTFTISLANGYAGYLPPPEQHGLGGYTTWPARSSCLEIQAEPKIRKATLALLRQLPDKLHRKTTIQTPGR